MLIAPRNAGLPQLTTRHIPALPFAHHMLMHTNHPCWSFGTGAPNWIKAERTSPKSASHIPCVCTLYDVGQEHIPCVCTFPVPAPFVILDRSTGARKHTYIPARIHMHAPPPHKKAPCPPLLEPGPCWPASSAAAGARSQAPLLLQLLLLAQALLQTAASAAPGLRSCLVDHEGGPWSLLAPAPTRPEHPHSEHANYAQ